MSRYVSLGLSEEEQVTNAPPDPEPVEASLPVAALSDRCIAVVLDSVLVLALFAVIDSWALLTWSLPGKAELKLTSASLLISAVLNAVILFSYLWLLEASLGATLGKAMVGIRVQWKPNRTCQRSALRASAIRNLLRIVDGLGFYLVGLVVASCSKMRQRIGDLCAGTVVVAPKLKAWNKASATVLWVAVLVGSGWAVPHMWTRNYGNGHRLPYLGRVIAQLGRTDNSAYLRVAHFKIEIQRNDNQSTPPAAIRDRVPTPLALAASD